MKRSQNHNYLYKTTLRCCRYRSLERYHLKALHPPVDCPFEQEIKGHRAFAKKQVCPFTGLKDIQEQMLDYFSSNAHVLLAICGERGSGKTALMAQFARRIARKNPNAVVISRFIGATPSSAYITVLLDSLCKQIADQYGADVTTPIKYKDMVEDFNTKLGLATVEKPLLIMIDALDQLSEANNAKSLQWLPVELPEQAKIIVSVLDPSEFCDQLKKKIDAALR